MRDGLCSLWNSEALRYISATALGFLIAVGTDWIASYRSARLLRTGLRNALAEEIADNFIVLDSYFAVIKKVIGEGSWIDSRWPTRALRLTMLERCFDPSIISVLTQREQAYATLAFYQSRDFGERASEIAEHQRSGGLVSDKVLNDLLEGRMFFLSQSLISLLCEVLEQQQVFASTRAGQMSRQLREAVCKERSPSDRLWRTSLLRLGSPLAAKTNTLIAWKNDARDDVPKGVTVITLEPGQGPYSVDRVGSSLFFIRPLRRIMGLWRRYRYWRDAKRYR